MKFSVGDNATIETPHMKLRVKVEDASNGNGSATGTYTGNNGRTGTVNAY